MIELANVLKSCVREFDLFARWGGEEFLVLFVDTELVLASLIAERIINAVRKVEINLQGKTIKLTVSLGLAQHVKNESYTDTFTRADAALYEAKNSGRNCFRSAPSPDSPPDSE